MAISFNELTIAGIHEAVRRGELSFRQLIEGYLKRIEAYDQKGPSLNSIIYLNPKALDIADEKDKEFKQNGSLKLLHGIPVLLKDNVDTKDMPTTGGSLSLQDYVPKEDAFITKKLLDAGAIILAKVNLHEFAVWGETVSSILGQTLNPYDLTRTPGGSSGGTGAGIAANFGVIGIGTDTINSIRSPASACSLVGIRPTIGLVSRNGIIPYSLTQDAAGPITRTVEDSVKVLDVISGYDPGDPSTAWAVKNIPESYTKYLEHSGLEGVRLGVLKSFFGLSPEHEDVNSAIRRCIEVMAENGATLIDIEEILDVDQIVSEISVHLHDLERDLDSYLVNLGDRASVHSMADVLASGKYHKNIEENLKHAQTLSTDSVDYKDRLLKKAKLQDKVMEIMAKENIEALIFPHQKRLACLVGGSQIERNGALGSVTGFPSVVVPAGFSSPTDDAPIGVPIGLEILGRPWSEGTLIKIAYSFENITQYRKMPLSIP